MAGPKARPTVDWGVTGRDLRVVDAAYDPDPDKVGSPESTSGWPVSRTVPAATTCMPGAPLAQSIGHWTIAAVMRPHRGFGERDAYRTLSTGE